MSRLIECTEGEPFIADPRLREPLRGAVRRLSAQLRPRFSILQENDGFFTVSGIVGTIALASGTLIQVNPKVEANDDWIHAVLDLLVGSDRVDAAGERAAGLAPNRRNLLDVLAAIYAARLQRAIRRDGPILLIERTRTSLPHLKGKLRATTWLRHAAWRPHDLPVSFDHLTPDNDFSRGLGAVAHILAGVTTSVQTRGILLEAARALRPGLGSWARVQRGVETRRLPSQWSIYQPAWSVAAAVLAQRSLLRPRGVHVGVSIALEAWPLLERLLERALAAAVGLGAAEGDTLVRPSKHGTQLLGDPAGSTRESHWVVPDGRLLRRGVTAATFEAKYKRRSPTGSWPDRSDIYQALCAAAVCRAPIAVLVYPEEFPTAFWRVNGFHGHPGFLAAVGLGLYSYRVGTGDTERGRKILDVLDGPQMQEVGQLEMGLLA